MSNMLGDDDKMSLGDWFVIIAVALGFMCLPLAFQAIFDDLSRIAG